MSGKEGQWFLRDEKKTNGICDCPYLLSLESFLATAQGGEVKEEPDILPELRIWSSKFLEFLGQKIPRRENRIENARDLQSAPLDKLISN